MASRPRRSAATKASQFISVHAKWADSSGRSEQLEAPSRRSGRNAGTGADTSQPPPAGKMPSTKPRPGARGAVIRGESFEGGEIVSGKRDRGPKKRYVVDSSPDSDDDDEDEPELDDDDDEMEDLEDADGDDMDVDAEGDDVDAEGEDADVGGSIMVAVAPDTRPSQRVTRPIVEEEEEDDDDDSLSEPDGSEMPDQTLNTMGDNTINMDDEDEDAEGEDAEGFDEDAEGDEIELAGDDAEVELDSEDGSQAGTPDVAKMTVRQRARFKDEPHEFMKLSDEVQVKKHFTAEENAMRRQEMARRRRNLSEKRNEEVKMETINKLLKKQAPKINKKAAAAAAFAEAEEAEQGGPRPSAVFVRWVSNKDGVRVAVPREMMAGPAGAVFLPGRKVLEEVV